MNYVERIKLNPSKEMEARFEELSNNARFIYNWMLSYCLSQKVLPRKAVSTFRGMLKSRELCNTKTGEILDDDFQDSLRSTPSQIVDMCCENLEFAFKKVRQNNSRRKENKIPNFKCKNKCKLAFTIHKKNDSNFKLEDNLLKITKIEAFKINLQKCRFFKSADQIKRVTISKNTYGWYISILIDIPDKIMKIKDSNKKAVGIDWGIKSFATDSDGNAYSFKDQEYYHKYKKLEKRLKELQRLLSHKIIKNKNWKKSHKYQTLKNKIAHIYERLANIRKDFIHHVSKAYVTEYSSIVIENLKPSNLLKNHKLARSIASAMFYTWKITLEYKCRFYGRKLILVNPKNTSQTCNCCGTILKEKLKLKDRTFKCDKCSYAEDRDINAAKNILALAF